MPSLRRVAALALFAPLSLMLAACGDSAEGGLPTSEPVAAVAPPSGQQWTDVVAITPDGGWLAGNPNAPIKLIEYGSLTCPACAAFSATGMQPLREEYVNSGRVSYELRSVIIHGAIDLVTTRLLECAPKEAAHPLAEQLWANNNAVLTPVQTNAAALEQAMTLPENQRYVVYAEQAGLLDFFAARGISTDQARQCLADGAAMRTLAERMTALMDKAKIAGTPTFLVNGSTIEGIRWTDLEPALQQAGAR